MRKAINTEIAPENNLVVPNDDLAKLIESYILNKENEKIYKDNASAENTQIKEIMHSLNINEFSTNMGTAKITEQTKETFTNKSSNSRLIYKPILSLFNICLECGMEATAYTGFTLDTDFAIHLLCNHLGDG